MSQCPAAPLCAANLTMLAELKEPGSNEGTRRVPQHPLGGHEEFGLCPASLMLLPLSDYDKEQLRQQKLAIERILRDRGVAAAFQADEPGPRDPSRGPVPPPRHSRTGRVPQPDEDARWFRSGPDQGNRAGHGAYIAPPVMPQVLLPPVSPVREPVGYVGPAPSTGGNSGVSSVEEVKAAISAAGEICATASQELFRIEGEVGSALEVMNTVRQTSVDPMGAPQISEAIEKIGEANALLRIAIEAGVTYKAGM